jgi:hypothetical protein
LPFAIREEFAPQEAILHTVLCSHHISTKEKKTENKEKTRFPATADIHLKAGDLVVREQLPWQDIMEAAQNKYVRRRHVCRFSREVEHIGSTFISTVRTSSSRRNRETRELLVRSRQLAELRSQKGTSESTKGDLSYHFVAQWINSWSGRKVNIPLILKLITGMRSVVRSDLPPGK